MSVLFRFVLIVGGLLLILAWPRDAEAAQPPQAIVDEINATTQPRGVGMCALDSLDAPSPCYGFVDQARRIVWVAIISQSGISHIFILREDNSEELRWCDPGVCK